MGRAEELRLIEDAIAAGRRRVLPVFTEEDAKRREFGLPVFRLGYRNKRRARDGKAAAKPGRSR